MRHHSPHNDQLRRLKVFHGCTDRELERVRALGDEIAVNAGSVIVRESSLTKDVYILLAGDAAVSRGGETVSRLHPGDHFGELAALDPAPRNASVTMLTDGVLLVLGSREFATLLEDVPRFSRRLLNGLAQRVHAFDGA
ncbi:MAG TPA: cyclic nucleotide-binding domain-containing protein [Mycobacteriales bacterium]|nr:cyclic nucleotide-binding domain-containing protein [Mycobacteriales bacterium]